MVTEHALMTESLWESVESNDIRFSEIHKKELSKRLTQHKNGETTYYTWDTIKAELNAIRT